MKRQLTAVSIIVILFVGYSAYAEIVYSQFPRDGGVLFGAMSASQIADDFTLTQPSEITSIRWWGDLPSQEDFTIRFFLDDDLGSPALNHFLEFPSVDHTRTPTSLKSLNDIDVYQYEVILGTPLSFQKDTKYYISILNSTSWGWIDSNASGACWVRPGDGVPWAPRLNPSADLAFELVPEPGTVLLFGLGGLALRQRLGQVLRRKK